MSYQPGHKAKIYSKRHKDQNFQVLRKKISIRYGGVIPAFRRLKKGDVTSEISLTR